MSDLSAVELGLAFMSVWNMNVSSGSESGDVGIHNSNREEVVMVSGVRGMTRTPFFFLFPPSISFYFFLESPILHPQPTT